MYGPIQFTIIGFDRDDVARKMIDEVNAVRQAGIIRLIDFLFVTRSKAGSLMELQATDLSKEEREQWGGVVGGLIGLGAGGVEGMVEGVDVGEVMVSDNDFGILAEDLRRVLQDIPAGTSAMVVLFEHAWAVPLKKAVMDYDGVLLAQGLLSPLDLVKVGAELAAAVEVEKAYETETILEESAKKVKGTKDVSKSSSNSASSRKRTK